MPTNEYGQPTDSKGNVKTQSQVIEAELEQTLGALYQPEITDLELNEHQNVNRPVVYLADVIKYMSPYVLKHRHDVYFAAYKDGLVQGRKEGQAMLDSNEEE